MTRRVFALSAAAAMAQTAPPEFEVASVKLVHEPEPGGYAHQITPGGLTMRAVSMGYCIRLAFGLRPQRPWELAGPAWIDPPTGVLFDIAAKSGRPVEPAAIRLMLQALLAKRFHLRAHRERRRLAAYALDVVSRRGLRPSGAGEMKVKQGKPYQLLFEHVTMEQLAMQLGPPMTSRPVVDRTGIAGAFDFTLDLGRYVLDAASGAPIFDANGAIDTEGATLRAVKEQLGLTLRPDHAEFAVLVIDHVDRAPSEE